MSEKVSGTALALNRLKHASAAYQEYKAIHIDYESTGVDPETNINEGDHMAEGFKTWPEFREEFLTDWNNNRRIVDEKEADMHFDNVANEALSELDTAGAIVELVVDGTVVASSDASVTEVASTGDASVTEVAPATRRRGRPPGSGKAKAVKAAVIKGAKRGRPASTKKVKAQAAKKKAGTNVGQAIVEKYGPAGRKWARKDVIEKLIAAGISTGYAPSVYQKFA